MVSRRISRKLVAGMAAIGLLAGVACSGVDSAGSSDDPSPSAAATTIAPTETAPTNSSAAPTPTTPSTVVEPTRPPSTPDLSVVELVQLAEPAIVRIAVGGGVGTGFVVDPDGFILTNNHVIDAVATSPELTILVTMSDGAVIPAELIGRDPRADLALLKIDRRGLLALAIGKLDEVVVGQAVVAIGFPLDLPGGDGASFSVSTGIISAKNRIIEGGAIFGAIQTDAAITNGNSGGPLLNLRGEVVGVNTAIAVNRVVGGAASGIGFAVGADSVTAVYDELRELGEVRRALIGISNFSPVRPARAQALGIPEEIGGIFAGVVEPTGPAGQAGLQDGDTIVRIADFDIVNESDLAEALIVLDPGDTVFVTFYRDGERLTVEATLGTAAPQ